MNPTCLDLDEIECPDCHEVIEFQGIRIPHRCQAIRKPARDDRRVETIEETLRKGDD